MANILIIEPDALLADTFAAVLIKYGHKARTVSGAQAAVDAADKDTPDIVFLELQLVAHSGIEFLCEFRSYPEWQKIPVVILSNVPPAEFRHSAKSLKDQLGVSDYFYKPQTNLRKLLRIVDSVSVPK
jgi:DNA-binding response OmpR family regulator